MFGLGVNRLGFTASRMADAISRLFSNGEAGVWYDPSDAAGGLTWQRNLLEYTESFDNSYYNGYFIKPTFTKGQVDPLGGNSAMKWNASATTGGGAFGGLVAADSTGLIKQGVDYTVSVYLKASGNISLKLGLTDGAQNDINVTTQWQRYSVTLQDNTSPSAAARLFQLFENTNADIDIYIWGAQTEEASTASSYQPILSTFENAFKAANPNHTLYQDYQGLTPVTAVGEPVGLMLDKSKGLAQGPELVTNGDFATDSGWIKDANWSIANGRATSTASGGEIYQSISVVAGKTYVFSLTIDTSEDSSISNTTIGIRTSSNSNYYFSFSDPDDIKPRAIQNLSARWRSAVTGTVLVRCYSTDVVSLDNISVTEIQGSHATQPTSTKRPIYARHPEGGIRNLFNYTEQFDNGYWSKYQSTITPNATTAPDGSVSADKFIAMALPNNHAVYRAMTTGSSSTSYTFTVYGKAADYNYLVLRTTNTKRTWFNISTGVVGTSDATHTASITSVGNGWYRCQITFAGVSNSLNYELELANADNSVLFAGDGTSGVYIWGAQFEEATEASNYQKVVTDIDVTESGVGEVYYLKFDGTDDGMSINNLTSGNTPLTALFGYSATNAENTAVRYLLDIETGRTVLAASAAVAGQIGYLDGQWSEFAADADAIKVLTYDLVENDAKIRIDGTQEYSDTTYDQKAIGARIGLFQNYPFTGSQVAGNMYQTILRAAESTDEEIAKAETYVANKTGLKAQVDGIATLDLNFGANTYTAKNSNGGVI